VAGPVKGGLGGGWHGAGAGTGGGPCPGGAGRAGGAGRFRGNVREVAGRRDGEARRGERFQVMVHLDREVLDPEGAWSPWATTARGWTSAGVPGLRACGERAPGRGV